MKIFKVKTNWSFHRGKMMSIEAQRTINDFFSKNPCCKVSKAYKSHTNLKVAFTNYCLIEFSVTYIFDSLKNLRRSKSQHKIYSLINLIYY